MSTEMHIPQHWRLNSQRYTLEGSSSAQGVVTFPPSPDIERRLPEHYDLAAEEEMTEVGAAAIFEGLVQSAGQPTINKVLEMETV